MESPIPLTEKQRFWQQHVAQAQAQGGALAEYARQHQLRTGSLYYWVGVFGQRNLTIPALKFSAVQIDTQSAAVVYVMHLPQQVTLHCPSLPDPQWLAAFCHQLDNPA